MLAIEINIRRVKERIYQITPGLLSWGTLIGLSTLALIVPFWIAIFIIIYDVYILTRAVYMSIHLIYAYIRMRRYSMIDWVALCKEASARPNTPPWNKVQHAVLLPTYDESLEVLRTSLDSLKNSKFPRQQLHVTVGFEERIGESARDKAAALTREYSDTFGTFLTTFHPDGLPGEKRVKSANAAWAMQHLEVKLEEQGIVIDDVLVSNLDSDTVVSPNYFSHLTHTFITHPDRYRVSYQPLPLYNNNLWDAPAFSRVIATGSTFWQMIESTRPERMVTFSSHAMTLRALRDVGYWQKDIISEERTASLLALRRGRCFRRMRLRSG